MFSTPVLFFCTGAGSLRPAEPGVGGVFKVLNSREEEKTSRMELVQRRVEKQPPSGARQGRAGREGGARGEEVGLPVRQQRWPVPGLACPPEPAAPAA